MLLLLRNAAASAVAYLLLWGDESGPLEITEPPAGTPLGLLLLLTKAN